MPSDRPEASGPVDAAGAGVRLPIAGEGNLCPVASTGDLLPTAGTGDLCPAASVGDLRSVLAADTTTSDTGMSLASPSAIDELSTPAPRWTGGGLAPVTTSKSLDYKKLSPQDEESSSSVDSGMGGREVPSICAILHALSCFSFLSLFLAAASFTAFFFFFTASP